MYSIFNLIQLCLLNKQKENTQTNKSIFDVGLQGNK